MGADIAVLTIHGMGEQGPHYAFPLIEEVKTRLGSKKGCVHFDRIYYQDILQSNQTTVFRNMLPYIDWKKLRKLFLYGFSDATSIETKKEIRGSVYDQVQEKIVNALDQVYANFEPKQVPVVIIAQSLGGQVISNYLWDSKQSDPQFGVWRKENGRTWVRRQVLPRTNFVA